MDSNSIQKDAMEYPSAFVSAGRLSKNTNELIPDENCSSESSANMPLGFN